MRLLSPRQTHRFHSLNDCDLLVLLDHCLLGKPFGECQFYPKKSWWQHFIIYSIIFKNLQLTLYAYLKKPPHQKFLNFHLRPQAISDQGFSVDLKNYVTVRTGCYMYLKGDAIQASLHTLFKALHISPYTTAPLT